MAEAQIKEWQRRIGVTVDGVFGQVTLESSLEIYDKAYFPAPKPPVPKPSPISGNPYFVRDGWLYNGNQQVSVKPSPNHGGAIQPTLVVIHYDGTNGLGGLEWLCSSESGVSAHLWIAKSGVVWQLLNFNDRAWHAGVSSWNGESIGNSVNAFSIGIENQGLGDHWPDEQVEANRLVVNALLKAYPAITAVVGHEDVAPGRKTDPGPQYPWEKVWPKHEEVA